MDDQNPYAAPQAELDESDFVLEGDPSIVRKGRKLIVPEGALLPTRCVKCNRPGHKQFVVKTSCGLSPPATGVCFLSLFGGVVLLLFFVYYDVNLLWLLLPAGACTAAVVYLERDAPRPTTTIFYICAKHQLCSRLFNALWIMLMLALCISPRLIDHLDFDMPAYYNSQYVILLVVIASISSGLTVRVLGKKIGSNYEFHGFGKKYLESFPRSDDT